MDIKNIFNRDLVVDVSKVHTKIRSTFNFTAGAKNRIATKIERYSVDVVYKNPKTNKLRKATRNFRTYISNPYGRALAFQSKMQRLKEQNENKI